MWDQKALHNMLPGYLSDFIGPHVDPVTAGSLLFLVPSWSILVSELSHSPLPLYRGSHGGIIGMSAYLSPPMIPVCSGLLCQEASPDHLAHLSSLSLLCYLFFSPTALSTTGYTFKYIYI